MKHHACYMGNNLGPTWIQSETHTYRPRKGPTAWKIVCVETGEVVEKYKPPMKYKDKVCTPWRGSWAEEMLKRKGGF